MDVTVVSEELWDSSSVFIAGVAAVAFPPQYYFTVLAEKQDHRSSRELPDSDSHPVFSFPITGRLHGHSFSTCFIFEP